MPCVIAVDAGTTSVRSVAVDEDGTIVAGSQRALTQHYPTPGWVEHDAEEIWSAVRATLEEVGARTREEGRDVAALGLTNQRETVVAWDRRSGRPLHRAIVWQDRRTTRRCRELEERGLRPLVRQRTGLVLDPYFSATKMQWLLEEGGLGPAVHDRELALATVDSWLLWRLTGGPGRGVFATDTTNASRTLLFDIHRREWDPELCALFSVPSGVLPDVHPSCGHLGAIDPAAIDDASGLAGVPVSGIAGDQHAALFGQACFRTGMSKVTYGTGSFVLLNCGPEAPQPVEGLLTTTAWDLGDRGGDDPVAYALEGSAFNSGSAIQWLRDGLGLIVDASEIGPLASSVEDSGGVVVVPAFTGLGSPWWDPGARGTVLGVTKGSGRAQLARAVVEAMTYQVRDMVEAMTGGERQVSQLRADGGAAVMDLLLQLQADQLGVPVARPRSTESTALGAAFLAGLGAGVWRGLEELSELWQPDAGFTPSVERSVADAAYAPWRRAVERSRAWQRV